MKPIIINIEPMSVKNFMEVYYGEKIEQENMDWDSFERMYPDIWTYSKEDLDERLKNGETDLVCVRFIEKDGSELFRYVETETVGGEDTDEPAIFSKTLSFPL